MLSTTMRRQPVPVTVIPPLENGDRLTRAEFERRFDAMPELKKAELIQGRVFTAPKVRFERHAEPHAKMATWLGLYVLQTPGVRGADNATVRLDDENEPQPDIALFVVPECGGRVTVGAGDYLEGAPELVVEIAASSASYDLHDKLEMYCGFGVAEYVVWRVLDGALDWFRLVDGTYVAVEPDTDGILKSSAFPGLWLSAPAILADDRPTVLATVSVGIADAAHAEFVASLAAAAEDDR
jgi:Uma2 family endonuclease